MQACVVDGREHALVSGHCWRRILLEIDPPESVPSSVFRVSWDRVYSAVKAAVAFGRERRDLSEVVAIGVDEAARAKGQAHCSRHGLS